MDNSLNEFEYDTPLSLTRRTFCKGIVVAGAAALAAPFLEEEADADSFKPSVDQQKKLGDQAAAQIERKYRIIHDSRSREFERVGNNLLDGLTKEGRGPWNYTFNMVDSKDINAFALPGGHVYMFTGLYDRLKTEDELAGVTGHEMTHVRKEHWAQMAAQQQKRQLGLLVLLGVTRAGRGWQQVAGTVDGLMSLKYSRKDEDEADDGGLQNMVASGYNPQGMLDLFAILQKASKGSGPSFLRDHPLTSDRIAHTQQRIQALPTHNFPPQRMLSR